MINDLVDAFYRPFIRPLGNPGAFFASGVKVVPPLSKNESRGNSESPRGILASRSKAIAVGFSAPDGPLCIRARACERSRSLPGGRLRASRSAGRVGFQASASRACIGRKMQDQYSPQSGISVHVRRQSLVSNGRRPLILCGYVAPLQLSSIPNSFRCRLSCRSGEQVRRRKLDGTGWRRR
jgi:hypothetical protein